MTDDVAPVLGPIGTLLEQAYSYAGLGLDIFPVNPRDKTPLTSQLHATTDLDTIEAWWRQWPDALIGHRISPLHLILDVDPRHGGKDTWVALRRVMPEFNTRVHYSGRGDGGGHIWFQRPADKVTITKLDAWAKDRGVGHQVNDRWVCGIDILRHEHRYTILPPSHHPETGRPYYWGPGRGLNADPAPMPQLLVDLIVRDDTPPPPPEPSTRLHDVDSIADWYTTNATWTNLLTAHGWTLAGGDGNGDGSRWRHPDATSPTSATIRHGCLFVYTPNTPFDVTYPNEPHGYTLYRAYAILEHHGDLSAAGRAARTLRGPEPPPPPAKAADKPPTNGLTPISRELVLTPAANIQPRRVKWCWDSRLALGTLGLLAGPEGLGKSTIAYTLAAMITRGTLPGEYHGHPRAVLVCASEDSWAHTIVPRLMAASADLHKVYRVEITLEDDIKVGLSLPQDIAAVEHAALETQAALLILDPLMSRLDGLLDSHKDGDVRRALEPVVSVADNTGMAILGLIHHNKSGSTDPLQLVMASKAFTAVARSVHTVVRDPDDETWARRYFGTAKNNLGSIDLPTLSFTIESWTYNTTDGPGATGQLIWGEEIRERIGDLLHRAATETAEERSALGKATRWLRDYMSQHGPRVPAAVALAEGTREHSEPTLGRARRQLGIDSVKDGMGGWMWVMESKASKTSEDSPCPNSEFLNSSSLPAEQDINEPKEFKMETPRARVNSSEPFTIEHRCQCGAVATDISGLCPGCLTNPGTLNTPLDF